jgi:hypothetical protein
MCERPVSVIYETLVFLEFHYCCANIVACYKVSGMDSNKLDTENIESIAVYVSMNWMLHL